MKMAKPSARDIEAAEELHQVLQIIDSRFGGPWPNQDAGHSLSELLQDGNEAFDCDNTLHLKTLYNHLARLLRNAPNFYGRVIGGMVWVIMNEANQILDPESDCIDLHPRFQQMAAECERLRGLLPEPPPRPPEGSGLPRYGLRWNGPKQPLSVPMDDGYWTPWHLADRLRAALTAQQLGQEPVAWLVDWPEEPELGHYFSDDPNDHARSRPLYTAPRPAPAQDVAAGIDGSMKLPCEVKLPGGPLIGKGCTLSTLLLALRNRGDDMPWRQRFGVPAPFDPRLLNMIAARDKSGGAA